MASSTVTKVVNCIRNSVIVTELHSPFQLVVLDGRIEKLPLYTKDITNDEIIYIANSFMSYDFVTF